MRSAVPPAEPGRFGAAVTVIGAGVALALAAWLAPASMHIVAWAADGPSLVALLPAPAWLGLAIAIGLTSSIGLISVWRWALRQPLPPLAWRVAPVLLLVLWVVPYVPGVGREWPLLLVLAGPTKWVIAALAMLGLLWAWVAAAARRLSTVAASRRLLFTTAFVLFLAGGVTTIRTMGPGGDEPHYLIIAHSLIRDGDLQIENNHTQRDHASFFGGALPPHYLTRGRNGVIYSVHAPGLPAVLAPAYAAAGYPGAVVMMVTLAAFLTVAMYDLARQVAGDGSARLTWAVTTVTVPMIPLAWMIYPEVAAALLVAWGARWIVEPVSAAGWRWAVRGLALAAMPWLHTKFAILLACLGIGLAVRLWPRVRLLAALAAPVAISCIAWLGAFYVMYGRVDPMAAYGGAAGLSIANVPRGILGLALDQEFGLLMFSPVYALALVGAWRLLRDASRCWFVVWSLATTGLFLGAVTQAYMWWGGASAPARFVLPLVPLAAPMLAAAANGIRHPVMTAAWWVAGAWSVAMVVTGLRSARLSLLLEDRDGISRLVRALEGSAPVSRALASFIAEDWSQSLAEVVPWAAAAVVAVGLAHLVARGARTTRADPVYWGGAAMLSGFVVVGAVAGEPELDASERSAIVRQGRGALLSAIDADRAVSLQYDPLSWLTPDELLTSLFMTAGPRGRQPFREDSTLFGPFDLPSGRYELRLFRTNARDPMPVSVVYHLRRMRGTLAAAPNGAGNPIVLPFDVPVDLDGVWARVPGDGATVARAEVVPMEIVPRRARVDRGDGVRAFQRLPGPGGSISFVDDATVPENGEFWVRHQQTGVVVISAPEGRQPVLTVTNTGPLVDEIQITAGSWTESLRLVPGESGRVRVPVGPERSVVAVAITTTAPLAEGQQNRLHCRVRVTTERRR